ncbi:MAG: hypothetical protein K9N29_09185, partial [Candidatus Marinimicrobia bacterium]|nr:hypothetical protein [Candidatus Neomarinimicrobiota bacterium]
EGWNDVVTTSSTLANISTSCVYELFAEMDLFVNASGLHLVVADDDGLFYKKFNSSGVLQTSATISATGQFANIVGDEDNLYIVYFSGTYVYVKKSTTNGASWTSPTSLNLNTYVCTGVDVAIYDTDLHIVYGKSGDAHYYKLSGTSWSDYKNVSGEGTAGGSPHIALSDGRVHVSWRTEPNAYFCDESEEYTRDKAGTTWEGEQHVITSDAAAEWLVADDSKLHMFYYSYLPQIPKLFHLTRDLDGEYYEWSTPYDIGSANLFVGSLESTAYTADGDLHVISAHYNDVLNLRTFDGSSWSTAEDIGDEIERKWFTMEGNSNDLYVFWAKIETGDYTIQYRQYDANPLTPTGFAMSVSGDHPVLTWNSNKEADFDHYELSKTYSSLTKPPVIQTVIVNVSGTSYTDQNLDLNGVRTHFATYKVRAVDVEDNESAYTSSQTTKGNAGIAKSILGGSDSEIPKSFSVSSAFPNPFNPSTTIHYNLPKQTNVSIVVRDIQGYRVTGISLDKMEAGSYQYIWNGLNESGQSQPGGLYLISFSTPEYRTVQKAVLIR